MQTRQRIAVLIGLLVSAFFLWIAFRNLNPLSIVDELRNINLMWTLVTLVVFFGSVYAIAWRWAFLVNAIKPVPFAPLNGLVWVGYMGNNVYPFRTGEALRAYLLQRNHDVPFVKGMTTIVVERVLDGLVLVTLMLGSLLLTDIVSDDVRRLLQIATPLFALMTVAFFVLATAPRILRRLARVVTAILPGKLGALVGRIAEDIIEGLGGLRSPWQLAGTVFASYLTWLLQGLTYWAMAFAFNIDATLPLMLLVVGAANLAGLIPASPGQIGVFEFFASAVLIASGVNEALALTYALTLHVLVWSPMVIAGFIVLIRQGLGWRTVTQAHQIDVQATDAATADASHP